MSGEGRNDMRNIIFKRLMKAWQLALASRWLKVSDEFEDVDDLLIEHGSLWSIFSRSWRGWWHSFRPFDGRKRVVDELGEGEPLLNPSESMKFVTWSCAAVAQCGLGHVSTS